LISYDEAKQMLQELDPEFQDRHWQHQKLRQFWQGRFWEQIDTQAHGLASIFRDVTSVKSDVGPDWKIVLPLVNEICVKYQSYLSGLPMIRTFVDRPTRLARAQASLRERALYGTWSHVNMNQQLNQIAWFAPLMGDAFLGIWPDFEYNCVKALVRSPEHAYPVQNFDGSKLDALLFSWKTSRAKAKRAFPEWRDEGGSEDDNQVEILEHSDDGSFQRWVGGQQTNAVQHDLGFNLFDQVPFIHVPGDPWNHGAVEQAVGMVEAGSAIYSLMLQAMVEQVFPKLILEDPLKFSETMDAGPGAVIGVNPGGKAYYLNPPQGPLAQGAQMLHENERSIKQATATPDVSFGQFDASIITGKAVNALQGAGTGSVVEMVQGTAIGVALEAWNEKALTIYQRMFANDTIRLYGVQPQSMLDVNPRQFQVSFKGSEIVGSPRNEVVFSPYIDLHGKLVMALQAQGAGLVSKQYGREQIGISDSEEMQEQIVEEALDEAVIGAIIQALQEPTPEAADKALAQAVTYLDGGTSIPAAALTAAPAPPPAQGGGNGGLPVAPLPGGGAVAAPAINLPPGAALGSQAGAPTEAAPQTGPVSSPAAGPVTLPRAQADLANAKIGGKAWLVGQIVAQGMTNGPVEVAITDQADRQPLADAASFDVQFHLVDGKPQEQAVEITKT
jgi:hypothetical protein